MIGVGGMGVVLAVHHLELGTALAVKLMRSHVLRSPTAVERFLREARAASAIENEHVARVTDFGRLENGAPYMAMELLSGEDLSQRLARGGPMPVPVAIDVVLQACEALAEAHMLGMVHRDLKPANLFLHCRRDESEIIKVLDFGISKVATEAAVQLTNSAALMGSPLYMSPEQLQNASEVDARTDVWALGVILYEATMGHPPFTARSIAELGVAIAHDDPPPMFRVPANFADVVRHCLAKHPADRFSNVGSLALALATLPGATAEHLASARHVTRMLSPASRPTASQPASSPLSQRLPGATTGASSSDAGPSHEPRREWLRWVVLAAGAGVMWSVLSFGFRNRTPKLPVATTFVSTHHNSAPIPSTFAMPTVDAAPTSNPSLLPLPSVSMATTRPASIVRPPRVAPPPLAPPTTVAPLPKLDMRTLE